MVITRLVGGLGNQMFQYASGYAVARENATGLLVDDSWYQEKNSTVWAMGYALGCFNITAQKIKSYKYKITEDPRKAKDSLLGKNTYLLYKEKSLAFDDALFDSGKNVVMDGYWQSEKYFKKYREEILREFEFKENPISEDYKNIAASNAISLHVRRGDYASHKQTNQVHGLMSLEYYNKAVEYIKKQSGRKDLVLFVFSDEPEWCKENLRINLPTHYVSGNIGHEDMRLMSNCKHHILANSSFSWWGAWLDPSKKKIVVAPKKWFNDTSMDSSDLVPNSWVRL